MLEPRQRRNACSLRSWSAIVKVPAVVALLSPGRQGERWYPDPTMRRRPVSEESARARAAMTGTGFGLVLFLSVALLWKLGDQRMAAGTAQSLLVLAIAGLAAVAAFGRPAPMRRARVPLRRGQLPQRPTREEDSPVLVLCAGAPVVLAAGLAAVLFH